MLLRNSHLIFSCAFILCLLTGCYPTTEVTEVPQTELENINAIRKPAKVFLNDGSILLFAEGCYVKNDTLQGIAKRHHPTNIDTATTIRAVPLTDIAAMTYYTHEVDRTRSTASFILGFTGSWMLPTAAYCLACPKCCFGSCPTVYTYNDSASVLEAELFSTSVSPLYEDKDLDRIGTDLAEDGMLNLRITNEALETHAINGFQIVAVSHPKGTIAYSKGNDDFSITSPPVPAAHVMSKSGFDATATVRSIDGDAYRTSDFTFKELMAMNEFDWLDVHITVPENATKATAVLRLKNTLLTTVLFYDMVLGSQGINAMNWTERISEDESYAKTFRSVYNTFAGVSVKVKRNGAWESAGDIADIGPISWKETALEIPATGGEELTVRFQFFPDNFHIDHIGFTFSNETTPTYRVQPLTPDVIVDNEGNPRLDVLPLIAEDDSLYLITNPGDAYRLTYRIPETPGMETTLFIVSKGYYIEWVRGEWIRRPATSYSFNLFDIPGTIAELSTRWMDNRELLEQKFFNTRIPVREEK